MKKLTALLVGLFLIVMILVSVPLVISGGESGKSQSLISPIKIDGKTLGLNQWFPKEVLGISVGAPQISAKAAFFVEGKSGRVLYQKNISDKLPIASLVKVMTAVIALEHKNLADKFIVSSRAAEIEPDKMLLIAGEKLTLQELLEGIFLVSANDGAEVLAEESVGSRDEFIKLMNDQASQLGMKNTYYANPTGLDEDSGNSYSSAYDLSLLTRYAVHKFPFLVDITKQEHVFLPLTSDHQDYDMYTGINLISTYPGVLGFKTGYTPEAGLTLITLARKNGHEVIGVLLGSEDRRDEARELLDYSFKKLD